MNRFAIDVEWQDAPGVRDPVLAKTWGRLTMRIDDQVITRVIDRASKSERDGVYGPLFPVAEWLVENFWFISNEVPRTSRLDARQAPLNQRAWMQRHNFVNASAGAALPNLTLASEGNSTVVANWLPDDDVELSRRSVLFISRGNAWLLRNDVETGIAKFINVVLDRLASIDQSYSEVDRLKDDWQAVGASMKKEETLCRELAKLGLDPYDVDDETIDSYQKALDGLPGTLRGDILDSEDLQNLSAVGQYVRTSGGSIFDFAGHIFEHSCDPTLKTNKAAHEAGYREAHRFRDVAQLPHDEGVLDLDELLNRFGITVQAPSATKPSASNVRGLVGVPSAQKGLLIAESTTRLTTRRFLQGRALGSCLLGQCTNGPRLLTDALTWDQAAARAFSAELLAPHAALSARVGNGVLGDDALDDLAEEFNVSSMVVAHQLDNHRIA